MSISRFPPNNRTGSKTEWSPLAPTSSWIMVCQYSNYSPQWIRIESEIPLDTNKLENPSLLPNPWQEIHWNTNQRNGFSTIYRRKNPMSNSLALLCNSHSLHLRTLIQRNNSRPSQQPVTDPNQTRKTPSKLGFMASQN